MGIGKTIATSFAMLRAAATHGLDKVFYLTAKSTGRQMAFEACARLRGADGAVSLRVLRMSKRARPLHG
jgi:DNA excision repair protein ERCC-2